MILINTHEAKTKLSKLINLVMKNNEIVRICRNDKPVAELVAIDNTIDPLKQHPEIKKVKILYNPVQPLSADEWPEENSE